MQVEGSVFPAKIQVKGVKRGMANVLLRRNITEKIIENNEDGSTDTIYQYEEVKVELANRNNIEQYIEDNFDMVFQAGLEKEGIVEETLEEKVARLEREVEKLKAVQ